MEMFRVPFTDLDGSIHHLVGMRELSNDVQQAGEAAVAAEGADSQANCNEGQDSGHSSRAELTQRRKPGMQMLAGTPGESVRESLTDRARSSSDLSETRPLPRIHPTYS